MSPLKRERHAMSQPIRSSLRKSRLMAAYLARPDYRQNDYIGWITRAKLDATREKRLNQMLNELKRGGV